MEQQRKNNFVSVDRKLQKNKTYVNGFSVEQGLQEILNDLSQEIENQEVYCKSKFETLFSYMVVGTQVVLRYQNNQWVMQSKHKDANDCFWGTKKSIQQIFIEIVGKETFQEILASLDTSLVHKFIISSPRLSMQQEGQVEHDTVYYVHSIKELFNKEDPEIVHSFFVRDEKQVEKLAGKVSIAVLFGQEEIERKLDEFRVANTKPNFAQGVFPDVIVYTLIKETNEIVHITKSYFNEYQNENRLFADKHLQTRQNKNMRDVLFALLGMITQESIRKNRDKKEKIACQKKGVESLLNYLGFNLELPVKNMVEFILDNLRKVRNAIYTEVFRAKMLSDLEQFIDQRLSFFFKREVSRFTSMEKYHNGFLDNIIPPLLAKELEFCQLFLNLDQPLNANIRTIVNVLVFTKTDSIFEFSRQHVVGQEKFLLQLLLAEKPNKYKVHRECLRKLSQQQNDLEGESFPFDKLWQEWEKGESKEYFEQETRSLLPYNYTVDSINSVIPEICNKQLMLNYSEEAQSALTKLADKAMCAFIFKSPAILVQ